MASEIYDFLSQKKWFPKTQEGLEELEQKDCFQKYCAIQGINITAVINYAIKQLDGNGDIEQMGQDVSGFEEMPIEKLEDVKAAYRDLCSNYSGLFKCSDKEELENTRGHLGLDSFCKSEHNVPLEDVIDYALGQLNGNDDNEQIDPPSYRFEEMPDDYIDKLKAAYQDLCQNWNDVFNCRDKEDLEKIRTHFGIETHCKGYYGVILEDVIDYAISKIEQKESELKATPNNDDIISETTESSSPTPRTDEILHAIKNARQKERYSQKLATPVFGGNRLSDEDGTEVAKYLFENNFDDGSIAYLKEKLKDNDAVILDTPYIFELALLDILKTDKYEEHEDPIIEYSRYETKTPRTKEFALKLDKLYEFITKERIEKERLDEEDTYIPAVNAIISTGFDRTKQDTINEIFEELKTRDAITETFEEFMKEKGNSKIQHFEFHPSVLIYNAVLKNRFEKNFTNSALDWYENISGTGFSECFEASFVPSRCVEETTTDVLTNIYTSLMMNSRQKIRENIEYIEYINTIKLAKDFLKNAGFRKESKNITRSVNEALKHENGGIHVSKALKIIKQQKDKRTDGTREKFVDVLGFMKSEGHEVPTNDTKNLLKEWYLQETKSKKGGKKTYRPYDRQFKTESLDSKILKLYQEFGGEKKDLVVKTPAQIREEKKAAAERQRQEREANIQREIGWGRAQREEPQTEYKRFQEEPGEEIEFTITNVNVRENKFTLIGHAENGYRHQVVGDISKSDFVDEPTRDDLIGQQFVGIVTGHKGNHLNIIDIKPYEKSP